MKKKLFLLLGVISLSMNAFAQDDPVVMRVNGKDVTRSEFEYNYNKNNTDGVIDRKSVEDYAQLFINYKLKVEAALDAKLDTLSSFQKEFRMYRDQQIRPMLVPQSVMDNECLSYYNRMKASLQGQDLIQPAHIFVRVPQTASGEEQASAKQRIDSIYAVLQGGALFEELAKKFEAVAEIEKHHEERYRKLLANINDKKVFSRDGDTIWICRNCGHIVIGKDAPEVCPVCNHPQSYFEIKAQNY